MAAREQRRDDLKATIEARRELGPDYESALVESFVDRVEDEIDARVDARLDARSDARRDRRPNAPPSGASSVGRPLGDPGLPLALGSLGIAVPLSAIAANFGHVPGLVVAWGGIVAVNVAHAWGRRRGPH